MKVKVKLYATLTNRAKKTERGSPVEIELPEGESVMGLLNRLKLSVDEVRMIYVNGRSRQLDWQLRDGDEVGLFPPVGGG